MKNTQPKKRGAAPVATIAALIVSALAAIPVTLTARNAMTHRPEHASGTPHFITHEQDGPTFEVADSDQVSVSTKAPVEENNPVLKPEIAFSLEKAAFGDVVKAAEKEGNIKIEHGAVKTEPLDITFQASVRDSLDMLSQIGNLAWERTGERTFKLVPAPAGKPSEPVLLDPKHMAKPALLPSEAAGRPEEIDSKRLADPDLLLAGEVIDEVMPVEARDIVQGNGTNGVKDGVILLFPPDMPSQVDLDLSGVPSQPGSYEVTLTKDAQHKTGWRLTYKKIDDVKIVD